MSGSINEQLPNHQPVNTQDNQFSTREHLRHARIAVKLRFQEFNQLIRARADRVFDSLSSSQTLLDAKTNFMTLMLKVQNKHRTLSQKVSTIKSRGYERLRPITASINRSIIGPSSAFVSYAAGKVSQTLNELKPKFLNREIEEEQTEGFARDQFFDHAGNMVAEETALRIGTVDLLSKGKKMIELESNVGEIADGATWGSTNTPRLAAGQEMLPVLCNLRTQQVKKSDGTVVSTVNRSAALSDFSHGEVSLQELKDYEDLVKLGDGQELEEGRKNQLIELYSLGDNFAEKASDTAQMIKINSLISYGTEKLVAGDVAPNIGDAIARLKESKIRKGDDISLLMDLQISPEKLREVINQREQFLKWVALQDLYAHFQTRHVENDQALYARVSLVEIPKAPAKSGDFILSEHTQGLDMKALFDSLDGATVLFDQEEEGGPHIDVEGLIHMPKAFAQVERATLQTIFFNISVRGNTNNNEAQGMINKEALQKLERLCPNYENDNNFSNFKKLNERLSHVNQDDPFDTALRAVLALQKVGAYVGINCYGGKDRTGYLAALITHHYLKGLVPHGGIQRKETLKRWGRRLVSRHGVEAEIIRENTSFKVLKLTRFDLKLYDTSTLHGKMLRGAALAQALVVTLKAKAHGGYNLSDAVGQLYDRRHRRETDEE